MKQVLANNKTLSCIKNILEKAEKMQLLPKETLLIENNLIEDDIVYVTYDNETKPYTSELPKMDFQKSELDMSIITADHILYMINPPNGSFLNYSKIKNKTK